MALMESWHFSNYCHQSFIRIVLYQHFESTDILVRRLFTFPWKFFNFTFHRSETRFSLVFHWIPFRSFDEINEMMNAIRAACIHALSMRYERVHEIQFQYKFRDGIFRRRRVYKMCNSHWNPCPAQCYVLCYRKNTFISISVAWDICSMQHQGWLTVQQLYNYLNTLCLIGQSWHWVHMHCYQFNIHPQLHSESEMIVHYSVDPLTNQIETMLRISEKKMNAFIHRLNCCKCLTEIHCCFSIQCPSMMCNTQNVLCKNSITNETNEVNEWRKTKVSLSRIKSRSVCFYYYLRIISSLSLHFSPLLFVWQCAIQNVLSFWHRLADWQIDWVSVKCERHSYFMYSLNCQAVLTVFFFLSFGQREFVMPATRCLPTLWKCHCAIQMSASE